MTTNATKHTPEFSFPIVNGMVAVEHVRYLRDDLRAENARLRQALQSAAVLRPKLLTQYGAVPECVLDFCNKARAALATKG